MPGIRILVADDEKSNRDALKSYLESLGHKVETAANYVDTRALLDANVYGLIVSDNGMPLGGESRPDNTCGLQLLAWAKSAGPNKNTPFVLLTGDESEKTKALTKELGGIYRNKSETGSIREFLKQFFVLNKIEQLKLLLLQDCPIMITGADFMAFNYGSGEFAGGRDSVITSSHGHARINRQTGAWLFRPEPNVRLSEVSHFKSERAETNLTFLQVKGEIDK
jgi:CheY-like chemotaxis protein